MAHNAGENHTLLHVGEKILSPEVWKKNVTQSKPLIYPFNGRFLY